MRKGRDLGRDLERLVAASSMFVAQEYERALGDDQDYDDAKDETHEVVCDVLDVLEKSMDEDLLEKLDNKEYPRVASPIVGAPRLSWRSYWPYSGYSYSYSTRARRGAASKRTTMTVGRTEMLDQVIDDFRSDFEARLKHARRDDRALTDAELDEALQELRDDLKVVVRRSRRREERREEREEERGEGKREVKRERPAEKRV